MHSLRITSLTPPLLSPCTKSEKQPSYICVLGASVLPFYTDFLLDFRTVPTVWYCFILFFIFLLFLLFHEINLYINEVSFVYIHIHTYTTRLSFIPNITVTIETILNIKTQAMATWSKQTIC